MIKLLLSIRSLDIGGAERQFIELVKGIDKNLFDVTVCTMYGGVLENEIKNIEDIRYVNLEKRGRYDISFYRKYKKFLYELHPDVIYSFLGEMNLFSLWCKPRDAKIIWGFRASNMDLKKYGKISQLLFWLQKRYSSRVDKIITNSIASIDFYKSQGFCMDKALVIENGIDTVRFRREQCVRDALKKRYAMQPSDKVIGTVARIDPMKGYPIVAKAMKMIFDRYENVRFIAVGKGDEEIKKKCDQILGKYSATRWIWHGETSLPEKLYPALDIYVSSSLGEGFSNSIAEAMACEVSCVVTDVGDSARIVADTGVVVEPMSAEALYEGIVKLLQMDYQELGKLARERIVTNFSIDAMVEKTQEEIQKCVE